MTSSRDSNDSATSEAGKQINDRSSSSSSGKGSGGMLTLAAEQRQLEREQQEAQQEANKILHSAVAIVRPQEMRFSNERVMLPNGMVDNPREDDDDNDDTNSDNVADEDEYFQSNFPSGPEQRQLQQQQQPLPKDDDRLKSDDYRLRYLYRIQDKYFG
ncbi:AAEL009889-PA [Aedes aegypti]|uniref:AAEL009889-PA n=1 Tax=Aedes aegypti TaxID=7159 RepID=Q16UH9_AEDAE|nr:AAEL009889-PA [Aedes aegypti]